MNRGFHIEPAALVRDLWSSEMAHKQVLFRSEARQKILRGTGMLSDAIRITLGPRSKSVLIERSWGSPIVCDDGVTIAVMSEKLS